MPKAVDYYSDIYHRSESMQLKELWLVHNPELHIRLFKDSALSVPVYTFINEFHYE
jgi:hypothetical protein